MRIKVPLSDLCLLITDGSHYSPKEEMNGVPMFSVKDMGEYSFDTTSAKRISEDEYQKLKRNGCEPEIDDVVIAKDGSVLKHVFRVSIKEKCVLLSSIAILRPNPEIVDGEFLAYSLKNPIVQSDVLANYVSGSGVPRIVLKDFKRIPLAVPDLKTQKSIASVLRNIDRKIFINSQISNSLEQIAQRFFKSWFIDFDPVKAKMAGEKPVGMDDATAALFPDLMQDSELGPIPKGWSKSSMGNFVQARRGKVITKSKTSEGSIPVIAGGLEPAYFHNVANVLWPVVTVSASGANAGFVRLNLEDIWASDCSFISKSETESVYTCYLFLKVQQEVIFSMQQGGAQPHIYPSDLSRLNFPVPGDLRIFERFEELIAVMFEKVRSLNNQTALLIAIRDSLLPRLISGELQIPEEMLVS